MWYMLIVVFNIFISLREPFKLGCTYWCSLQQNPQNNDPSR